ncbi:hypothetical protein [Microvirga calopogonii]|uniref:hypothetical protein n=1 Tax=Microvirga calopogonii TaxID=2078013 RepID=UPI0013B40A40|nr:hypothetical protein [Microvirga calopogonii]
MSKTQDVLRPYWLKGINEISSPTAQSLKGWLSAQQYVVQTIDPGSGRIEIFTGDPAAVSRSFAHDIDRFSSAVLETVIGIVNVSELPGSYAWSLIRCYYAAFYAAHAIGRIFGESVSRIDIKQVQALQAAATSSGIVDGVSTISDILYKFRFDPDSQILIGERLSKDGPHVETWKHFEKMLADIQNRILQSPTGITSDKQQVVALLQIIRDILTTNTAKRANWLSTVRNDINYRHEYGAWYPHGKGKHWGEIDTLFRGMLADPLTLQDAPERKDINRFAKGCVLLIAVLVDVLKDISARHPANASFLKQKANRVLATMVPQN